MRSTRGISVQPLFYSMSAYKFFEDLRRRISVSIVAVAVRDIVESLIAFFFGGVPVNAFPVVAEQSIKCVPGRQRYAYTEAPLKLGAARFDKVV